MLKGGVIGFGRMGLTHFSIMNNHPDVQFVAVCDSSSFMLKNVSRYLGVETFKDYRKMIDRLGLDFVIVATPTGMHAEIVKYAIQNNLHIFVEKPFALNVQQGEELVGMLKGKKLVNQVGYASRFNEVFLKVKEHLDAGLIGNLCHFKFEMRAPTVLKTARTSWRTQKSKGGGCLHDLASHGIDLVNYLVGPPDRISGSVLLSIFSTDAEDIISSTFHYKQGFFGNLLANWSDASCRKPNFRLEFYGSNGRIIATHQLYKVFLIYANPSVGFDAGWNLRYVTDVEKPVRFYVRGTYFTQQLDYFIDCILNEEHCRICSFEDGLKTDHIIESIIRDSQHEVP